MTSQTNPAFGGEVSPQAQAPSFGGIHVNTIFAIQALLRATADRCWFRRYYHRHGPGHAHCHGLGRQAIQPLPTQASRGVADAAPSSPAPAAAAAGAPPNTFRTTAPWVVGFLYLVVPAEHLTAIAEQPQSVSEEEAPLWYCITKGKYVGVTLNHPLALAATVGVSGCRMKSYKSQALALQAFNDLLDYHMVTVVA
ncbi:hypothetical protein R3P38DRAFT_2801929 [Favolaschia claudopus]|uniref:Uncharacterized protein n=1 Tax=Favolaschia claudopus TaxID=2862362 RepID=A0AAV9ZV18_9AGAR